MLKTLKDFFKRLNLVDSYQESLEAYLATKDLKTTYDVEYWIRQFDRNIYKRLGA